VLVAAEKKVVVVGINDVYLAFHTHEMGSSNELE
jgi:hypothetical protein